MKLSRGSTTARGIPLGRYRKIYRWRVLFAAANSAVEEHSRTETPEQVRRLCKLPRGGVQNYDDSSVA